MERSRSAPVEFNPFYSNKARAECLLQSSRPKDLPTGLDGDSEMDPLQASLSGVADQSFQSFQEMSGPTGKGRGVSSASELGLGRPLEQFDKEMKTEGVMPTGDTGMKFMGPMVGASSRGMKMSCKGP